MLRGKQASLKALRARWSQWWSAEWDGDNVLLRELARESNSIDECLTLMNENSPAAVHLIGLQTALAQGFGQDESTT